MEIEKAIASGVVTIHPTAVVHNTVIFLVEQGQAPVLIHDRVKIGPYCILQEGVEVCSQAVLYSCVRLDRFCKIGRKSFIGHGTILRECTTVGDVSVVAHLVCCEGDTAFGHDTIVHDQSHVTKGAKIGDYSFLGPMSMGVNDRKIVHRRPEREDWKPTPYEVGDWCRIGAGAIMLPGVKIKNNSQVGAGAVVTKDVEKNTTVMGVPAKEVSR